MIAVIETGGKQYLIREGQTLKVEKLDVAEGSDVTFDKILLVADEQGSDVKVGAPYVMGATVTASVDEQGRDPKVRVVKFKNKIRYKRVFGHRQPFTKVTIKGIA